MVSANPFPNSLRVSGNREAPRLRQNPTSGFRHRDCGKAVAVDSAQDRTDDVTAGIRHLDDGPVSVRQSFLFGRTVRKNRQISLREAISRHMHEGLDVRNASRPPDRDEIGKRDLETVHRALPKVELLNVVGNRDQLAVHSRKRFRRHVLGGTDRGSP
jgi:hypothetical protein